MTRIQAVVLAAAAMLLLLAPLGIPANAHGHGSYRGHYGAGWRHGGYGAWPLSGGVLVVPPPDYTAAATPTAAIIVPAPTPALSCHHSRQTVTVPAQAGGTAEITVTRC